MTERDAPLVPALLMAGAAMGFALSALMGWIADARRDLVCADLLIAAVLAIVGFALLILWRRG